MALAKITSLTGRGVCVPGADIDTDRIIPARFMKCITFDGLGEFAFYDERKKADGSDKPHPLNDPRFAGASVLISGSNFGCGSSREHAPIALGAAGCEVVVAESFARIFFRNSVATGELYPYESTGPLADKIKTGDQVEVDFDKDELRANGQTYKLKPLGEVKPVIDAGGIFVFARQSGLIPARKDS